jgi:hypothetical protein
MTVTMMKYQQNFQDWLIHNREEVERVARLFNHDPELFLLIMLNDALEAYGNYGEHVQ